MKSQDKAWKVRGTDGQWAVGRARGIQNHGPLDGIPPWEMSIVDGDAHSTRWPVHLLGSQPPGELCDVQEFYLT